MSRVLNKTAVRWNDDPQGFECRLTRSTDPANPALVVWQLSTGYDVLTAEGEAIHQDEEWLLPAAAVTVAEGIRTRVITRVKARNSIP